MDVYKERASFPNGVTCFGHDLKFKFPTSEHQSRQGVAVCESRVFRGAESKAMSIPIQITLGMFVKSRFPPHSTTAMFREPED